MTQLKHYVAKADRSRLDMKWNEMKVQWFKVRSKTD